MVQVKERLQAEVKAKFDSLSTDLTKMEYLESVMKTEVTMDVKAFAWVNLAVLYDRKMMYDKAAKAMYSKAGFDATFREKIESYIKAAEYFAKAGNIMSAEDMFSRAVRESNSEQKGTILARRENIYFTTAEDLEKRGRMTNAIKFYEKILSLKISDDKKRQVKEKMILYYKKFGRFSDAKMIENMK